MLAWVHACVSACVCMWGSIAKWSGLFIKRLLLQFTLYYCFLEQGAATAYAAVKWVSWEKHILRSCNTNGYLLINGDANVKLLPMSANVWGLGGTWERYNPACEVLALQHGAWLLLNHPRVVLLGQRDCLATARDFAFLCLLLKCVFVCVMVTFGPESVDLHIQYRCLLHRKRSATH